MEKELSRIGGDARFVVKESKTFFLPAAPLRGFEKMVEGKSPLFVVEAVMRICGICHAAHAIASCEAFEHAFGIFPPRNGIMLREAIGLLNRIQSHFLHNIMILPDLLNEKYVDDVMSGTLDALEKVNKVLTDLAGAPTHPNRLVIGGIAKALSEKILEKSIEELKKAEEIYNEIKKIEVNEFFWSKDALLAKKIDVDAKYLASHLFYGDRYAIDPEKIEVIPYSEIHEEKDIAKKSTSMLALYDGEYVEVGPRARLKSYRNFSFHGMMGLQIARLEEITLAFKRIEEILKEIDINQPVKTEGFMFRKGKGVGVYEAPRGLLIHRVSLNEEGRVENYSIIVPTMFNIPLMEKTNSEMGIRLYDPCIPCATHCVEVI